MNIGALLQERDRLLEVIAEAKTARSKLTQLNKTIAMFSDDPKVSLEDIPVALRSDDEFFCPDCDRVFGNAIGVRVHRGRMHNKGARHAS